MAAALALFLTSGPAAAFCRATTCEPKETCQHDDQECVREGLPLFWPGGRLAVSVSAAGSVDGITGEQTEEIARMAFSAWQAATCADGLHPGLRLQFVGQRQTTKADRTDHLNLITFVDSNWQDPEAVAITTVTFDTGSGRILDSDTRINAAQYCIIGDPAQLDTAVCDPLAGGDFTHPVDLLGVLTHEAGHQLGLDHTLSPGATMATAPTEYRYQDLRNLEPDDEAGICAIYPTAFEEDLAGGGLSCRAAATPGSNSAGGSWPVVALAVAAWRARQGDRRKRRFPRGA